MEMEDAYHQSGLYSSYNEQSPTATPTCGRSAAGSQQQQRGSANTANTTSKGRMSSLCKWRQGGAAPVAAAATTTVATGVSNNRTTGITGSGRRASGGRGTVASAAESCGGGGGISEEEGSSGYLLLSEGEDRSGWLDGAPSPPPPPPPPPTSTTNTHSIMETSTTTTTTVDSCAGLVQSNTEQPGVVGGGGTTTTLNCLGGGNKEPRGDASDCGLFAFRPAFLQPLANIKIFVLLLSMLVMVQQALASGYLNSVITTIEKRYEIPSYLTGVISSFYEIGNVITVIFVSYLGSRRRIPVWIAVGCLVMGLGSILFVVPQLAAERWSIHGPTNNGNDTESNNICRSARVRDDTSEIFSEIGFGTLPDLSKGLGHSNGLQYTQRDNCIEGNTSNVFPVFFFVLAQLLLGAGGSPLLTLGTTYIDDHVKKESSSMYIGIIYTMVAFGPVLGFLLGGYLLSYYVDSFFVADFNYTAIDHKHPRWIGMWWGGFLICGLLLLFLSIPFFMFPKTIKKEKEKVRLEEKTKEFQKGHRRTKSQTSTCSRHSTLSTKRVYGKDVRDIPMSMLKLLVNPIYVMTCLGACMELIIVSGFVVFLPKYLETQFSISNVQASIFTGGIAIPGACIGTFLGGYLLKRLSLRPKGAIQMVMAFNLMGLSLYGLLFVLGCDNVKMAGTTSPYFNSSLGVSSMAAASTSSGAVGGGSGQDAFKVNLTAWCNLGCSCRSNLVEPVCGNNGLTYFSPCHAGCSSSSAHNFVNCSCILGDPGIDSTPSSVDSSSASGGGFLEVTAVPVATAGPCYIPCNTIKPFMVLLFFMSSAVAISQMPLLMIVLRSVDEEERSFALGVQFVIFRLIAYIPAPIMFGSVIDSTCLLWKTSCDGEKGGRCLLYDIEEFRYRYVGICTAIKILSAFIFLFDWLLIRWKYKLDMDGTMTVGDIVNSLMSVDKVISEEDEVEENVWLAELQGTQQGIVSPHGANVGSQVSRPHATSQPDASGHKRSHSGTHLPSSRPWASQHRRSHSSCGYQPIAGGQPPAVYGILATQPGHQRRASAGQQVTFRGLADDPGDLTGVRVMIQGLEELPTDLDHSPLKV